MKALVLGGTGKTGKLIVKELLAQGYSVRILTRDKKTITVANGVEVFAGNPTRRLDINTAVNGVDLVINAAVSNNVLRPIGSKVTQNVLAELGRKPGLSYVTISTIGAGNSYDNLNPIRKFFFSTIFRPLLNDKNREEELIKHASVRFMIFRPGALTNGANLEEVKSQLAPSNLSGQINRITLAKFIVTEIIEGAHWNKIIDCVATK